MKKITFVSVLATLLLCLSLCVFASDYGNPIDTGSCGKDGDNVIWTMYDSGTLVISGQGEMEDFGNWADMASSASYVNENFNNSLNRIVIENGVTSIGDYAFLFTWDIFTRSVDVSIPESVKYIGHEAFGGLLLNDYTIPETVTGIGENIFGIYNYSPGDYYYNTLPEWYKSARDGLLYYDNILHTYKGNLPENQELNIEIKEGTRLVSANAFSGFYKKLKSVYVPNSVQAFEGNPFRGCPDVRVTIADDNPYMCVDEYGVIYNADKTKLIAAPANLYYGAYVIPDTVIEICDGAFSGCKQLYSVEIGSNVKEIGEYAFYDCDSLSSVIVPGNVKIVDCSAFSGCDNLEKIDLLFGVEIIYDSCFSGCEKLSEINLPNSLTAVGGACFYGLKSLKFIDLPDSITSIVDKYTGTGPSAPLFSYCNSLEIAFLPDINYLDEFSMPMNSIYASKFMKTVFIKNLDTEGVRKMIESIEHYKKDQYWFPTTTQFIPVWVGSTINNYLNTDIVARIDGAPIRSYNIDGYTVIIAEDLKNYGFNVNFDNEKRILYVDDIKGEITSTYQDSGFKGRVGDIAGDVLYTDIDTYVNGLPVKSYNIGGYTAIYISDLQCFGSVVWNDAERTISFTRN